MFVQNKAQSAATLQAKLARSYMGLGEPQQAILMIYPQGKSIKIAHLASQMHCLPFNGALRYGVIEYYRKMSTERKPCSITTKRMAIHTNAGLYKSA